MDLYLIDGSSYFYRAYHAIKRLSNSKGFPTNAIYGFTNMLFKIIKDRQPDALAITFDSAVPTERHRIYEEYKAQRPEMPGDLAVQIPYIKEIVKAFNVPLFEIPGCEADDIIGTIAKKAAAQGATVFIVSGDKDMMQLVQETIKIYDPLKDTVIDEAQVRERFGVPPERIPEIMALTGDAVDNIPGAKGIGDKTAKELIRKAGTLDALLSHPEAIEKERIRRLITESIENIKLSRVLATIDTNLPIEVDLTDLAVREPDWPALLRLFTEFEFKSLIKLIPAHGTPSRGQYLTITDTKQLLEFLGISS